VAVIVKKRRTLDTALAAGDGATTDDASSALAGERRPRVFVVSKEPAAEATAPDAAAPGSAPSSLADAAGGEPRAMRRRRRRLPEHRPSPVVHIVLPPAEAAPADKAVADEGFVLELPSPDAWRELQAALVGVRRLVDDAESARGWALQPRLRPRRRTG
jgi:hypothetical protein